MTIVLGIDPGGGGAFATYDSVSRRLLSVEDMPVWYQAVGKRKRRRVDAIALATMFETYDLMGVELVVIEAVGGRTGQGAAAGFVFGYGVGLVYMAALYNQLVIESIPPASWKRIMNVPGKGKADDSAIVARADEMFPYDRAMFRGDRGGLKVDRAEAAMLAKFGADYVLQTLHVPKRVDTEWHLAYHKKVRETDTGA